MLDLSFEAQAGSVFCLLGPNGAGKTTTINMLTTLLPDGRASVAGFDLAGEQDAVRKVIGLAGQAAAVDEKLTARENLDLFGRLYKLPKAVRRARVEELMERFRMSDYADRTAGTYAGGQRRRLDVVASLIANRRTVSGRAADRFTGRLASAARPTRRRHASSALHRRNLDRRRRRHHP